MIKIVYSLTCVFFHIYTEKDGLDDLYVTNLQQICREYKAQKTNPKFPDFSKARKAELIQMIRDHRIALVADPVEKLNEKMGALVVQPPAVEKEAKVLPPTHRDLTELQEMFVEECWERWGCDIINSESHPFKSAFALYVSQKDEEVEKEEAEKEEAGIRVVCVWCVYAYDCKFHKKCLIIEK